MTERIWRVVEILDTSRRFLEEKGIENPRGNAEALLGKVLKLPRIELYLQHDRPLTGAEIDRLRELLRRRARHEPLQLLLGTLDFAGAKITVQPGVLIPRPETEELVEKVFALFSQRTAEAMRVLDIGTGSGCIAVALARRWPNAFVDAVDVDYESVRLAARNADDNGVGERVNALLADVLADKFPDSMRTPYDLVISNPPYIAEKDFQSLAPEIREHEPKRALVAGSDGLRFYRRIAELMPEILKPQGRLALEIGYDQSRAVIEIFLDLTESLEAHEDLAGIRRFIFAHLRDRQIP